jgi:hypothetical protein
MSMTTEQEDHSTQTSRTRKAFGFLCLSITGLALAYGVEFVARTHAAAVAAGGLQVLSSMLCVGLILMYANTCASSPLVSIVLACLGWQMFLLPASLYDITSLQFPIVESTYLGGLEWMNVLALVLAISVAWRLRTLSSLLGALIVCASAIVAYAYSNLGSNVLP